MPRVARARVEQQLSAQIHFRAILAALDEALSVPVPRAALLPHDRTYSPGEAALAVSALEREVSAVTTLANELRLAAALERKQCADWERRAMMSAGELRHDLAQQATVRAAQHQQHAEQIEDELREYEALESEYRQAIEGLRSS